MLDKTPIYRKGVVVFQINFIAAFNILEEIVSSGKFI
jgi:hypothetical protein